MSTLFLKPGKGRTVDQEDGTPWPVEGMAAERTLWVRRRIDDLDLVEAEPPAEPPAEPKKPARSKSKAATSAETPAGDA